MLMEWVFKMREMYTSNFEVIFARAGALIDTTCNSDNVLIVNHSLIPLIIPSLFIYL